MGGRGREEEGKRKGRGREEEGKREKDGGGGVKEEGW